MPTPYGMPREREQKASAGRTQCSSSRAGRRGRTGPPGALLCCLPRCWLVSAEPPEEGGEDTAGTRRHDTVTTEAEAPS